MVFKKMMWSNSRSSLGANEMTWRFLPLTVALLAAGVVASPLANVAGLSVNASNYAVASSACSITTRKRRVCLIQ